MPQRELGPDPGMYCLGFFFNKFSFPHSSCYTQRWKKVPNCLEAQDPFDRVKCTEKPESPAWEDGGSRVRVASRNSGQGGGG